MILLSGCVSQNTVTRRRGSVEEEGRVIPSAAYAWYNRGLYHERRSQPDSAMNAFAEAIDLDRQSGKAWASLGRVECEQHSEKAMKTFSTGLKTASRKAPIYIAQGRCYLSADGREGASLALDSGLLAIKLEPSNVAATRLVASCYRSLNREKDALRFERSYRIFLGKTSPKPPAPRRERMDRALQKGDIEKARSLALGNTTPGELAVRAYALGKRNIARQQAELVSGASPTDSHAALTLVLLGESASTANEDVYSSLSPLASLLLSIHIRRSLGASAASQFDSQYSRDWLHSPDPLIRKVLKSSIFSLSKSTQVER